MGIISALVSTPVNITNLQVSGLFKKKNTNNYNLVKLVCFFPFHA